MRPPHEAGEVNAVYGKFAMNPADFNEAPARGGGGRRAHNG